MTSSLLAALVGDGAIEALFSDGAEIQGILAFESALAGAQADAGMMSHDTASAIDLACSDFEPDMASLKKAMAKDGVVVPSLIATLRKFIDEPHAKWLHFGATSQDAIDTSLVLRLKKASAEIEQRLSRLIFVFEKLRERNCEITLMAHTRMQRALPFTAGDKIDTWLRPLQRHRARLQEIGPRLFLIQLGGPVGTRDKLGDNGSVVVGHLADRLNLGVAPAWHTARDGIVEFGSWLSLVSGTLGKIGADIALMAQNEVSAVQIKGGGSSSAMPHKANPVEAEILVTLGRFNATLVGGLHHSLIHENERSGAAWTLEWMLLPQMVIATAAGLNHANNLAGNLEFKPERGE